MDDIVVELDIRDEAKSACLELIIVNQLLSFFKAKKKKITQAFLLNLGYTNLVR